MNTCFNLRKSSFHLKERQLEHDTVFSNDIGKGLTFFKKKKQLDALTFPKIDLTLPALLFVKKTAQTQIQSQEAAEKTIGTV